MRGPMFLAFLASATLAGITVAAAQPSAERGATIFAAGGCQGCHTDAKGGGALLAGGRALETPFGTFYGPNITPDPQYGIGGWSDADFLRAMREGVDPEGRHLYPVFPYPSYTRATDADLLDLKAYIFGLPAVAQPSREHEVSFPFSWRFLLGIWKWLNFEEGAFEPEPAQPAAWNRGAYLVTALGHCGECHSPRGWLGGVDTAQALAGNPDGPEGEKVPNLTGHAGTGLGDWSERDIVSALKIGLLPDGDFIGGAMGEVVENSTSKLTEDDLQAIAAYLKSLPPIENAAAKATQPGSAW